MPPEALHMITPLRIPPVESRPKSPSSITLAPFAIAPARDRVYQQTSISSGYWGMTTSAYTPLESLLLFQSLATYGVEQTAFSRISELLSSSPLIRDSKTFDSGRLQPDALRQFYVDLLKEEIKSEEHRDHGPESIRQNGDVSPESRKRKLSSLPSPSIRDASEHAQLVPQLIDRLYARYRDSTTQAIREDEQRFQTLEKEVREIEQLADDARAAQHEQGGLKETVDTIGKQENGLDATAAGSPPAVAASSAPNQDPSTTKHLARPPPRVPEQHPSQSNPVAAVESSRTPAQVPISTQSEARPPISKKSSPKIEKAKTPKPQTPIQPAFAQLPGTVPLPTNPAQHASARPIPQPTGSGQRPPSATGSKRSTPAAHKPPPLASQPNAFPKQFQNGNQPLAPGRPSSPMVIQPQSSPNNPQGSLAPPSDAQGNTMDQQQQPTPPVPTGLTPAMSPTRYQPVAPSPAKQDGKQTPQPFLPQIPPQQNYMQHISPYSGRPSPYPPLPQQQQYPQNYYPPKPGGIILPPFPATPSYQPPSSKRSQHEQQFRRQSQTPVYVPTQGSPAKKSASPAQQPIKTPYPHPNQAVNPPLPTPSPATISRTKSRPPPIHTPASSTRWKNGGFPPPPKSPGSPIPPGPDAVSPISERASSPEQQTAKKKAIKTPRGKGKRLQEVNAKVEESSKNEAEPPQVGRAKKPAGARSRKTRAASTASSAVASSGRARTRSQSVASHADELSMDTDTLVTRRVKHEHPATPAGIAHDEDTEMTETSTDERGQPSWRRRRGSTRTREPLEPARPNKRKRSAHSTPDAHEPINVNIPNRPRHVLCTRNFPRTSATIMNDVTAHKHASMFANPVKEKDAPGYRDLIYRPQDLKSIKTAIAAGGRAVTAAVSQAETPLENAASPGLMQGSSTPSTSKNAAVWIPATSDVVPPKGIVNSAQLEKELMRMFANAVMFNPDPDRGLGPAFHVDQEDSEAEEDTGGPAEHYEEEEGRVVKDTREMFETVERSVEHWRSAERAVEDSSAAAVGPVGVSSSVTSAGNAASGSVPRRSTSKIRAGVAGGAAAGTGKEKGDDDDADELAGDDRDRERDERSQSVSAGVGGGAGSGTGTGTGAGPGGRKKRKV
ncbi:MAG: hypothetical protein M1819_002070 [Sarea resinae]|nr:MAG: hypothetical protein M1819_002070 [Sarea resinae]